jgi:PTS system nitrogen regulatory IIA component
MNQISQLLPVANILLDLDARSKERLFETLGTLFEGNLGLSRSVVVDSLLAREKLGSTGLGQGIAIGAFVRMKEPIAFDAPDGKPVAQLFVLLVPEQATEQHLQLLSELAQMFSERSFRDRLASAPDAAAVHREFVDWRAGAS